MLTAGSGIEPAIRGRPPLPPEPWPLLCAEVDVQKVLKREGQTLLTFRPPQTRPVAVKLGMTWKYKKCWTVLKQVILVVIIPMMDTFRVLYTFLIPVSVFVEWHNSHMENLDSQPIINIRFRIPDKLWKFIEEDTVIQSISSFYVSIAAGASLFCFACCFWNFSLVVISYTLPAC